MIRFSPFRFGIDAEILRLLEAVSRRQGEISAMRRAVRDEAGIGSIANVDAVHFSTRIEGNALSRDQVTSALQSGRLRPHNRALHEVLNYAHARRMVRDWAIRGKPFDRAWILQHHAEVQKGIVTGKLRGHYREAACAITDAHSRSIVYMAADWKDAPELMKGLLAWLRQQKQSGASAPLLAAQFHLEFVTIHPFMDGNGRLARLLTNGILWAGGYDVERYAAIEKFHEQDRDAYYRSLRSPQAGTYYDISRTQDIRGWIAYWLDCLLRTYDEAAKRLDTVPRSTLQESGALPERVQKADALFRRHRRLKASEYADLMGLGRTQAVADLNALVNAGSVERVGGGRSTVYRCVV